MMTVGPPHVTTPSEIAIRTYVRLHRLPTGPYATTTTIVPSTTNVTIRNAREVG